MQPKSNRLLDPEFANLLLESMADGVFTLDQNGRITLWNRAIERITGYSAEEALGRGCEILDFNL